MEEPKQQTTPQLRGLYSKVKISVRSLNIIIVVLAALLIVCMAYGIAKGGFRVSFDTQGGTVVESQIRMYGELLEEPELPTREGFVFDGWYLDPGGTVPWNTNTDVVTESMTLYAKWKEK
ncbi:MAG: InlB B-repeat-containing protein [Lachnospiraceae bacterium]|nr:InlB B-repeat-containing protein [Lachnospiraceae bacterium]